MKRSFIELVLLIIAIVALWTVKPVLAIVALIAIVYYTNKLIWWLKLKNKGENQ